MQAMKCTFDFKYFIVWTFDSLEYYLCKWHDLHIHSNNIAYQDILAYFMLHNLQSLFFLYISYRFSGVP